MEFLLHDHSTNTRRVVSASGDTIVIGRDGDCGIRLNSPFIARRHAQILRRGNQLFLEALSRAGVTVANRSVPLDHPTRFDFGDEIQIGPYTLAAVGRDRKSARADHRAAAQAQLMEFEKAVHAELLDRLNLRVTGHLNKSDAQFVNQCLAQLDQLIVQRISDLPDPVIAHTLRTHLHRLVIAEVVRQCQGRVQTEYRDADPLLLDPRLEQQVTDLVTAFVDAMPLRFEPASVTDDLAAAEDAFDSMADKQIKQVSADLRRYLVRRTVGKDIADILFGLGPLQDLLDMPSVSEVMVVGRDRIYIEKNGVIQPTTRSFFSDEVLLSIVERILTPVGRRIDTSTPLVDARLPDGSRVNVVISPLSLVGPCVTIRKFGWVPFTMDDLVERSSISGPCAAFLQGCVLGRMNIVISGGTGSGKTTLLNVISAYCRPGERIITIEESAELKLPQPHVVSLEGRPANVEGRGAFTIRDLVRNALRMRPDRIIVGEVRGPEALDMLQAMNTGHDGSLTTLHANTPADATRRLETLVLMGVDMPIRAIREQIVTAIDLIVQVARYADGRRRVSHISEVTGLDPDTGEIRLEDIFRLTDPDQPRLRHTGYLPTFANDLATKHYIDVSVFL